MCRKIAAGEVVAGMSKEHVTEAVAKIVEVRTKKGEKPAEEWIVEGRNGEKIVLKFDGNALVEIERK
jgi:hypothetical protein